MKDFFKKTTTLILVSSVIAFIIGLMMAAVPGASLQVIGIVLGIYMMIHGCALITLNFTTHNVYIPFHGIMSGLLSIIVGIILVAMPGVLTAIFGIALGIWIILSSFNTISIAISIKGKVQKWYLGLILGIIDLICGLIILFNPFASSLSLVILGGIITMIHSVITFVDTIAIKKNADKITKALESKIKQSMS